MCFENNSCMWLILVLVLVCCCGSGCGAIGNGNCACNHHNTCSDDCCTCC